MLTVRIAGREVAPGNILADGRVVTRVIDTPTWSHGSAGRVLEVEPRDPRVTEEVHIHRDLPIAVLATTDGF